MGWARKSVAPGLPAGKALVGTAGEMVLLAAGGGGSRSGGCLPGAGREGPWGQEADWG